MDKFNFHCLAIIPARYASTRFPGKMLETIGNKTLIQHTYENAQRCKAINEIVVATDDLRILHHVESFGGKAVMTSPTCLNGTERASEVYSAKYLAKQLPVDVIINLQGDEPCVEPDIIEAIVNLIKQDPSAVMSTAIAPIVSQEEALSSSVVKCVISSQGEALYFSRALIPGSRSNQYNSEITYYKHIGIYAFRPDFLLHYANLPNTPWQMVEDLEQLKVIEHGYSIKVAIVEHECIGVDTPADLKVVEPLLRSQNRS